MDDQKCYEAMNIAAKADPKTGIVDVLIRARAAGVAFGDVVLAFLGNIGDVTATKAAIEMLIAAKTPPTTP